MIYEELKTGLKIYSKLEQQDRFIKPMPNGYMYQLITPKDTPLPFQFRVKSLFASVLSWKIVTISGAAAYDMTPYINLIEKNIASNGYTYFSYKGSRITGFTMAKGFFYMQITVGSTVYCSEVFCIPCDSFSVNDEVIDFVRLEWYNSCDLNETLLYQTGYKNRVYLDTLIHNEAPTIEEDGEEDGEGNFYPSNRRFVNNLSLKDAVPYYLADSLVAMSIHDNVSIVTPNNAYSGTIREIKPALQGIENSALYELILTFQQDTVYINTGCCKNMTLT